MQQMEPAFISLTICVSGKCSAAYECGMPPNFIREQSGSIRVYVNCDELPEFICADGNTIATNGWCRVDYSTGGFFKLTLLSDGFRIEGLR